MSELQKILKTSTELFFRYGIKSVSMSDIASELGISKKTIYQFVENKEDLVSKSLDVYMQENSKQIEAIFRDTDNNAIDVLVQVARINSSILRKINPSALYDLRKYYKACWEQVETHQEIINVLIARNIKEGIEQGLYRSNIDIDIVTKFYVSQIEGITDTIHFPAEQYNMADVYVEFLYYHIYGIASDEGKAYFNKIIQEVKEQKNEA